MYGLLSQHLPKPLAELATALWYVALILLVAYLAFEPKAEFSYLNV